MLCFRIPPGHFELMSKKPSQAAQNCCLAETACRFLAYQLQTSQRLLLVEVSSGRISPRQNNSCELPGDGNGTYGHGSEEDRRLSSGIVLLMLLD